jgi:hypothetical protein
MNSRLLIFLFLVLISENVFSQIDTVIDPYFEPHVEDESDAGSNSIDMGTYFKLKISTDKYLREAKDRINLLEKYAKVKEDSLRACRNPVKATVDSFSLVNVGRFYALIIAVSDYENEEKFPDLPQTIIDGKNLEKVLLQNYVFESVELLLNPTKKAILMKLSGLVKKVTNIDNVLIFYAGHGYMWKNKKRKSGYWCPSNAKWEDPMTLLSDFELLGNLQLIDSRNTLLISDACHASSITESSSRAVKPPKSKVIQIVFNKTSFQYISSGSDSEVPDDSEFLKNLVDGLNKNADKYLAASDLYSKYLKHSYTEINTQYAIPQMSTINGCGHELGGDFFFIKKDE